MFGMFYGLYGTYWFPFLDETHGPVLLDVLRKDGYQMRASTSAAFTYPEFDHTIFAQFGADELHPRNTGTGWKSDRANVTSLLAAIDARDASRPFFSFMFFESPHARYEFPPESVVAKPYLEKMNYATMDLERDIELIRNRYRNACHHLDSQLARIFQHLDEKGLLDSTIVIVTGDHGEEFMEKGRWGHNSAYTEEQIRTPFVMHVPGRAPEVVTRMTSHLDIAPTVMNLLGVQNPPSDDSLGYDLFGPKVRDYTVVAQWSDIAYVDSEVKVVFPIRAYGYSSQTFTTRDDAPLADQESASASRAARFAELAKDLGRFGK
jgi:membrane-anchored protein YejM (alkaline phosphatase superfamily)